MTIHPIFENLDLQTEQEPSLAIARGDEVFLVSGSIVRCADIKKSHGYKILDTSIEFKATKVQLNPSQTLLAIIGETQATVLSLPEKGFLTRSKRELICVRRFNIENESPIVCVAWNPTAKYDANLVILNDKSQLKSFELFDRADKPALVLSLRGENQGIGLQNDFTAVSITFGSRNTPSALTLYIFTEEGDIYYMYPLFPSEMSVSPKYLDLLLNESALLVNSKLTEETLSQFKLANDLFKHSENAKMYDQPITVSTSAYPAPVVHGPLSVSLFPENLYESSGCDIACLEGQTDILLCSWDNGTILILARLGDFIMNCSASDELTVLDVLETSTGLSRFHDKTRSKVLVCSSKDLISITMNWINLLDQCLESKRSSAFLDALHEGLNTSVEKITSLPSYRTLNGRYPLITEANNDTQSNASEEYCYMGTGRLDLEKDRDGGRANFCLLGGPFQEITRSLPSSISCATVDRALGISGNGNSLSAASEVSQEILTKSSEVHRALLLLYKRMFLQKEELMRQIEVLNRTRPTQKDDSQHRLEGIFAKNQKIAERLALLGEKFSVENKELPLSKNEYHFIEELNEAGRKHKNYLKETREFQNNLYKLRNVSIDSNLKDPDYNYVKLIDFMREQSKLIETTRRSLDLLVL